MGIEEEIQILESELGDFTFLNINNQWYLENRISMLRIELRNQTINEILK